MRAVICGFVLFSITACTFDDLDLSDRSCPCAEGFVCDTVRDRCVESLDDAGPPGMDSGADAGGDTDAGMDDAGAESDAGPTPRDAGPPDAGPPAFDAGPPTTVCGMAPFDTAIICEDFEIPGLPGWDLDGTGETAQRTTAQSYLGDASLQAQARTAMGMTGFLTHRIPAQSSGELWMRMYIYVSTDPYVDFTFAYIGESATPFLGINLQIEAGGSLYAYIGPEDARIGGSFVPREAWTCVRLRVLLDDTAGEVALFQETSPIQSTRNIDTLPAGGIDQMTVGVVFTDPTQGPATVYLDEVALSTVELPCD